MGAVQPNASPEVIAERQRRNRAADSLRKLARSDDEKFADNNFVYSGSYGTNELDTARLNADRVEKRLQQRRQALAASLAPDAADKAISDATGRLARRARSGSSRSALGSYDMTKPLGPDSILGGS